MTPVLEVHHGAADGDPALLLEFEPVAGRIARSFLSPSGAGLAQRASVFFTGAQSRSITCWQRWEALEGVASDR
jgi:hypothetical protein